MPVLRSKTDVQRMLDSMAQAAGRQQKDAQDWMDAHMHPEPATIPATLPPAVLARSPFPKSKG